MGGHRFAGTTHTLELRQVQEMNARLSRSSPGITAARLGVRTGVPGGAVLSGVKAVGEPTYPYVYGVFARTGEGPGPAVTAELHTPQLRAISDGLGLRQHHWGV